MHISRSLFLLILVLDLAISTLSLAQDAPAFPQGTSGEFVSLNLRTGNYFRVNPAGCAKRFAPYSTYKVPNSLIGLETGVISDPDQKWHWEAAKYPPPKPGPSAEYVKIWQQDQDLRSALSNSIVWYYRELAKRVGKDKMGAWLKTFEYGNQDISGGLDVFWLGNSLRISPNEQVEFLARLQRGQLSVSQKNLNTVKQILTQDSTPDYKLIAKTGSSLAGEGWFVGWVESEKTGGCTFALHMKAASYGEIAKVRPKLAREFLRSSGCIPS